MSQSRAAALKAHYEEQRAKAQAERDEREARKLAADIQTWKGLEATLEDDILTKVLPEGVTIQWDDEQRHFPRMFGSFIIPHDGESYGVRFVIQDQDDGPDFRVNIARDDWRKIQPEHLAEFLGAAIAWLDQQAQAQRDAEAEQERRQAERDARNAQYAEEQEKRNAQYAEEQAQRDAENLAYQEKQKAEKAARRAEKLARRVAEVETLKIAELRAAQLYHVNPSGVVIEDIERFADATLSTATDAAQRLPGVEQLRAEINIFERQLKEAQAAATWGVNGANDTERKNNAARALAADPQVKQIQTALDQMNRRLAIIEPEYKAVAMRSGAWRAVAELYAGWLQSLR